MASVFGALNSFLCRRNFLHKQVINKIRKYTSIELSEQLSDQPKEIVETVSPLLDTNDLSQDLCFHVRNEMINKHVIEEEAVDTRILDICLKARKPEIAKAYVNYLESNGCSINLYALARYLQSYHADKPVTKSEEDQIINIFKRIQKEWVHVPPVIMKNCIIALCHTHEWRVSLELIKEDIPYKELHGVILPHIIPAAFRNGEINIGLTLLEDIDEAQNDAHKFPAVYEEYLNHYLKNKPAELNMAIEKIFCLWRKYDVVPIKYIIDNFVNVCDNVGWETKYVAIQRDGNCRHCGNYLSAFAINDKTFKRLAKDVISKALIDTDIFRSTTPLELKKFKNFIHKTKPYDIVIDGLNVSCGQQSSKWLKDIVDYFSRDNKKILIIARQHMYPRTKWVLPLENVYIYFFENITNDDPYILYATLMSGNNAKFVTFDLLRQHVHKLEDRKIQRRFRRWQYTHQYSWNYNTMRNKVFLTEPWLSEPFAQYNNGYWHIPYRPDIEKQKLLYKPVETWICFRSPQS